MMDNSGAKMKRIDIKNKSKSGLIQRVITHKNRLKKIIKPLTRWQLSKRSRFVEYGDGIVCYASPKGSTDALEKMLVWAFGERRKRIRTELWWRRNSLLNPYLLDLYGIGWIYKERDTVQKLNLILGLDENDGLEDD